mmetsp:Transcript_7309/g.31060  ORF Transcript_7309/g.31060 Transcript_7309/m.31060 type:complete len:207 (-) Transcript_7309:849-1469(-)
MLVQHELALQVRRLRMGGGTQHAYDEDDRAGAHHSSRLRHARLPVPRCLRDVRNRICIPLPLGPDSVPEPFLPGGRDVIHACHPSLQLPLVGGRLVVPWDRRSSSDSAKVVPPPGQSRARHCLWVCRHCEAERGLASCRAASPVAYSRADVPWHQMARGKGVDCIHNELRGPHIRLGGRAHAPVKAVALVGSASDSHLPFCQQARI